MSLRTERVAETLRIELMDIILKELKDPKIGIATITAVRISPDLKHAWAGVSVFGEPDIQEETIAALKRANGYIRREIGKRLDFRVVPEIVFELDRAAEHSVKISKILNDLEREKPEDSGDEDV
jgi:ribosome-binding factor A